MSWRDLLRMNLSDVARQGAAKLSRTLEKDVGTLFRRRPTAPLAQPPASPTTTPSLPVNPALASSRQEVKAPPTPARNFTENTGKEDGDHLRSPRGDWTASHGTSALALDLKPQSQAVPIDGTQLNPGEIVADLYEIERVLATTGEFTTYVARHLPWNLPIVLKVPQPVILESPKRLHQLAAESGRWTACGFHPHITYCYQLHFIGKVPLLVIEYMDGGNLRNWLSAAHPAPLRDNLDLAIQICQGLSQAHARGVWHGRLKPENILLTKDGIARITDLGIAQSRDTRAEAYVSPERWVDTEALDPATDIFALGVCLYELFCGARPYEVARGPRRKPLEPRSNSDRALPTKLSEILKAAVEWDRARRPVSVAEIGTVLAAVYRETCGRPSSFTETRKISWEADGWNNQGTSAALLGRVEEAETAWENALAVDPHHLEAIFNLGILRWHRGDCSDGALVQQLRRARADPDSALPVNQLLALVHLESGAADIALPLLEEVAQSAPSSELERLLALARRMQASQQGSVRRLDDHLQFVSGVCISEDGRWALSASDDCMICFWDLSRGTLVRTLDAHTHRIAGIAMTPDARLAVSGSDDFTLRVWDLKNGKCIKTLPLQGKLFSVGITADGRRAVSSSSGSDNFLGVDGTVIQLWDLETSRMLRQFEGHENAAKPVTISADGRYVISGSDDHTVRVWDAHSGECLRILEGHEHYVSCVATNHDGSRVLSGSWDRTVRLWDVQRGRCTGVMTAHVGILTSVYLSRDGRYALSGSWDGTVRLWDLDAGRCLRTFEGHDSIVSGVALSGDNRLAISGGWDRSIRVWETPKSDLRLCKPQLSRRKSAGVPRSPERLANDLLLDAERASAENRFADALRILEELRLKGTPENTERIRTLERRMALRCPMTALRNAQFLDSFDAPAVVVAAQWSGEGRSLFTAGRDNQVHFWDVAAKRCLRTLSGHTDRIHALRLAHNGALAVTASSDTTLRLWDLTSGTTLRTLEGHQSVVSDVTFTDEERCVLSAGFDHTLRLWELGSGECIRLFRGHLRQVTSVVDLPGLRWAASGSYDASIRLWDLASGRCIKILDGHRSAITALALSSDEMLLASACADGRLHIWNPVSGKLLQILDGHTGAVTAVRISRDGRWVFSGSVDGSVRVWELSSGNGIEALHSGGPVITNIALTDESDLLLAADAARSLKLLELQWDFAVPAEDTAQDTPDTAPGYSDIRA